MRSCIIICLTLVFSLMNGYALSCPVCRRQVQAVIHAPDYTENLLMMALPIVVILAVSFFFYYPASLKDNVLK